jgi:hypothetical protein
MVRHGVEASWRASGLHFWDGLIIRNPCKHYPDGPYFGMLSCEKQVPFLEHPDGSLIFIFSSPSAPRGAPTPHEGILMQLFYKEL